MSPCSRSAGSLPILPAKHKVVGGISGVCMSQQHTNTVTCQGDTSVTSLLSVLSKEPVSELSCQGSGIHIYVGLTSAVLTNRPIWNTNDAIFPSTFPYGVEDGKPWAELCALRHDSHSFWPRVVPFKLHLMSVALSGPKMHSHSLSNPKQASVLT